MCVFVYVLSCVVVYVLRSCVVELWSCGVVVVEFWSCGVVDLCSCTIV